MGEVLANGTHGLLHSSRPYTSLTGRDRTVSVSMGKDLEQMRCVVNVGELRIDGKLFASCKKHSYNRGKDCGNGGHSQLF